MPNSRLNQLSDGIFAIVMTLLVIDLRMPEIVSPVTNQVLWTEFNNIIPLFLSYVLSFTLLFTYWRAHHFFTSIYAKNTDSLLTNINALFLLFVSLIPFSSNLLGQFSNNELAVTIFGIHIIIIGLILYWMKSYVFYSSHIKNPDITKREIRGSTVRTLVPVLSAAVAIPLSFYDVKLSLTVFTLAVIFNLSSTSARRVAKLLFKR